MGTKLPPNELELYHRVDEVLHYIWDPAYIARTRNKRDEYYDFIPIVFSMLKENDSIDHISSYLTQSENDSMHFANYNYPKQPELQIQQNLKISNLLQDYKSIILDDDNFLIQHKFLSQKTFFNRVDEVLFYLWDPALVSFSATSRDRYRKYIVPMLSLLEKDESSSKMASYLTKLEDTEFTFDERYERYMYLEERSLKTNDFNHEVANFLKQELYSLKNRD